MNTRRSIFSYFAAAAAGIFPLSANTVSSVIQRRTTVYCDQPQPITDEPNTYSLKYAPIHGNVSLFRNGLRQFPGVDYRSAGNRIEFLFPTDSQDLILADYDSEI